jgi:drug/metabolite transporter (DMT)-like permease
VYFGESMAFLTAIIWAFATIMFKKSGETVHPIMLNLFKDVLGFVLLIPTAFILGQELLHSVPLADYILLLASGVIGIGIADTFYFMSLNRMPAGLIAIIACLYSPFVIALSVIFLGETLTVLQISGAVMIVLAVLTGVTRKGLKDTTTRDLVIGITFGVIAVGANASGIVMIKHLLEHSPLLWVTVTRLLAGIVSLSLILLVFPNRRKIVRSIHSVGSWKYTLTGSFFATYLAMVLWLAGMKYAQASIASALNQTSNLFVFLFAFLILKEGIDTRRTVGILMGVAGAVLVSFG